MESGNTIYRVTLGDLHCRSSAELVILKLGAVKGVHAATVADGRLTLLADPTLVTADDLVRTLISAGVTPVGDITAASVPVASEQPPASHPAVEVMQVEVADERHAEPALVASAVAAEAIEPGQEQIAASAPHLSAPGFTASELPAWPATEDVAATATVAAEQDLLADIAAPATPASPRTTLVQRIKVEVSDAYYPSRIEVIPGVPIEIEFGEGHGCLSRVLFNQFGIDQDLTQGGATVQLPGLAPGTYGFSCGMQMVFGSIVADA